MISELCARGGHCWHAAPRDLVEQIEDALRTRFAIFDRCCGKGCDYFRWKPRSDA